MRIMSLVAICLLVHTTVYAQLMVGHVIPELDVTDNGELILANDKFTYHHWSTQNLVDGKIHTIQHLAGRKSAKEINAVFIDKLEERGFSGDTHHVTTIVNLDDSFFGTTAIVRKILKNKKKQYPSSTIVADEDGLGAKLWKLSKKNSAIIILSAKKQILFFKEGALNEQEINQVLELIQTQIKNLKSASINSH